jgi:hypothetical protein
MYGRTASCPSLYNAATTEERVELFLKEASLNALINQYHQTFVSFILMIVIRNSFLSLLAFLLSSLIAIGTSLVILAGRGPPLSRRTTRSLVVPELAPAAALAHPAGTRKRFFVQQQRLLYRYENKTFNTLSFFHRGIIGRNHRLLGQWWCSGTSANSSTSQKSPRTRVFHTVFCTYKKTPQSHCFVYHLHLKIGNRHNNWTID